MAIFRLAHELAVGLVVEIPAEIVDDEKIEKPVVIYVHPRAPDRPKRPVLFVGTSKSSFFCHVGERSVAIVVVKRVPVNTAHKNIFISVVVIVSDGYACVVANPRQTRLLGYVRKRTVAVVVK